MDGRQHVKVNMHGGSVTDSRWGVHVDSEAKLKVTGDAVSTGHKNGSPGWLAAWSPDWGDAGEIEGVAEELINRGDEV